MISRNFGLNHGDLDVMGDVTNDWLDQIFIKEMVKKANTAKYSGCDYKLPKEFKQTGFASDVNCAFVA